MASLDELGRLTDEESADLLNRVERFQAAWKADGSTGLEWYLPPPGTRHRPAVLVEVVVADMERRAPARLPFRVERYVNLFPEELSTNGYAGGDAGRGIPAACHRYTDKPPIAEYQRWFPAQFDELVALSGASTAAIARVRAARSHAHHCGQPGSPRAGTPPRAGQNRHPQRRPPRTPRGVLSSHPPLPAQAPAAIDVASLGRGQHRQSQRGGIPASRSPPLVTRSDIPYDVLPTDAPYQLVRKIGSGAFGEVFEALAPGGVKVAVKRILRSVDHPASKSEKESLEAIKWLAHPFLLKTNAYWVFDDKLVIVMELADGSLTDRIAYHQERDLPGIPPEELVPFFEQAGEAARLPPQPEHLTPRREAGKPAHPQGLREGRGLRAGPVARTHDDDGADHRRHTGVHGPGNVAAEGEPAKRPVQPCRDLRACADRPATISNERARRYGELPHQRNAKPGPAAQGGAGGVAQRWRSSRKTGSPRVWSSRRHFAPRYSPRLLRHRRPRRSATAVWVLVGWWSSR